LRAGRSRLGGYDALNQFRFGHADVCHHLTLHVAPLPRKGVNGVTRGRIYFYALVRVTRLRFGSSAL
jgi:hypothetical protein